jgi:hypothetical protein
MSRHFKLKINFPSYTLPAVERKRHLAGEASRFFQMAVAAVQGRDRVRRRLAVFLEAGDQSAAHRLRQRLRRLEDFHAECIGLHLALLVLHAHLEDEGGPPAART